MLRRRPIAIGAAHVRAVDADGPCVGVDQAVGEAQQRGLAGAGAADDAAEFALGDVQRDIAQSLHAPAVEAFADVRIANDGRGGGHHD